MRTLVSGLAISAIASVGCFAQSVISAHSGVIHYAEGTVLVNDKAYEPKTGEFTELKDSQVLKTEEGRVELLLTPGVFLRAGENSSVRMVSNRLSDTRVEVLQGEALVECDELLKDNQVTMLYKDASVAIAKAGLYRFDSVPGRLRVYDGEAIVKNDSGQLTAKKGQEVALNGGALMASKFDTKAGDELMRWAARRSGYISMANVAAARSADSSNYGSSYGSNYGGYGYGGYGNGYGSSLYNGWAFNPYFGMFTFVPMSGILYSPFGDPFWSPYSAFMYAPGFYPYYGYGYGGYGGYGGYSPVTTASTFNPTGRFGGYSGARVSHSAPIGSGGGYSGRGGYSSSSGFRGNTSSSSSSAISSPGLAGGGHMGSGGGHR